MADNVYVFHPDMGVNGNLPDHLIDDREVTEDSKNILVDRGVLKTAFGLEDIDTESALDGKILGLYNYEELDKYDSMVAVTENKIYKRNPSAGTWSDITQSGLSWNAIMFNPVSFVGIPHTDSISGYYHHCVICDGGRSDIQVWAGHEQANTESLSGGGGYHDYEFHRAWQVATSYNRLILINPKAWDGTSWNENNQRVRWTQVGELLDWHGTGSGFADLNDTGGHNVWAARLGATLYVYQNNSIWALNYLGGKTVFSPSIAVEELGLLAPHALASTGNIHYFIGHDYNIYAFYGGSVKKNISEGKIQKAFEEDFHNGRENFAWCALDAYMERLWVFIASGIGQYPNKAYIYDRRTEKWMIRDFTHLFTGGQGITACNLFGSATFTTGDIYQDDATTTYAAAASAGTTYDSTLTEQRVAETMALGTSEGYIYSCNEGLLDDDGTNIPTEAYTKRFDLGDPTVDKRWPGIAITAKGGQMKVQWRFDDDTTWSTGITRTFSSSAYSTERFYINRTGKTIQFRFSNVSGSQWEISQFTIMRPQIERDRDA